MATAKHTAPRFDLSDKDAALARLSPEGVSALLRLLTARPARPTMGA
jgi:hypothetical protein